MPGKNMTHCWPCRALTFPFAGSWVERSIHNSNREGGNTETMCPSRGPVPRLSLACIWQFMSCCWVKIYKKLWISPSELFAMTVSVFLLDCSDENPCANVPGATCSTAWVQAGSLKSWETFHALATVHPRSRLIFHRWFGWFCQSQSVPMQRMVSYALAGTPAGMCKKKT